MKHTAASSLFTSRAVPNGPHQYFATVHVLSYIAQRYGATAELRHRDLLLAIMNHIPRERVAR